MKKILSRNFCCRITEEVTKQLISRNIFSVRVNLSFHHTVKSEMLSFWHCEFRLTAETYSCMDKSKLLVWFSRTPQFLLLHLLMARVVFFLNIWVCLHDIEKLSPTRKKEAILANIWGISASFPRNVDRVLKLFANTLHTYLNVFAAFHFF